MRRLGYFALWVLIACPPTDAAEPAAQARLIGRWPLQSDARDISSAGHDGRAEEMQFTPDGALFNGRTSRVEIPHHSDFNLGAKPFSLSLRVHTDEALDDILGDLVSKFDPAARRGFNLSLKHHAGATGSQSNYRNLQFGIDNAQQDAEWKDEGRPGNSIFIHSMAVHDGDLYVGTVEGWTNNDHGHVYRYDGKGGWEHLGAPWRSNGVTAMASFDGHLYVGVSRVLLHYSGLAPTIAHHIGGKVFRYEDGKWVDLGQLLGVDGVQGMAEFQGQLHVTGFYQPAMFRYEGGTDWTSLGTPDGKRPEALCVYNGSLYATGYDEGAVYRYDGQTWSRTGMLGDATQVYGIVVHDGQLLAGTWPHGTVYRYGENGDWTSTGRLGNAEEVMSLNVYNGKLYAGTLPMAEIYRHDADENWTSMGRVDFTPDAVYRRAWSMAVFKGRLFSGTLPSGHVRSFEAGKSATMDREFPAGWHHIAAVRDADRLKVYVDGELMAESSPFAAAAYDLDNGAELLIGSGQHDRFRGSMRDVRLYAGALSPDEIRQLAQPD